MKARDYNFPAPADMTNISVMLDDEFFEAYDDLRHFHHFHAVQVYNETVKRMLKLVSLDSLSMSETTRVRPCEMLAQRLHQLTILTSAISGRSTCPRRVNRGIQGASVV